MKKILIAMMLCLCIGSLTACYGDSSEADGGNSTQSSIQQTTPENSSLSDESDSPESSETGDDGSPDEDSTESESASPEDSTETPPTNTCKITFIQEGAQTITRYVNKGETLIDIPSLQPVTGYDVAWSATDFSNIQEDMEITVVKTPKTYTVTYKVESGVIISSKVQKIVYQSEYTLLTPKRTDYEFRGWKLESTGEAFASEGTYAIASDIVLVPIWRWIEGVWVT